MLIVNCFLYTAQQSTVVTPQKDRSSPGTYSCTHTIIIMTIPINQL